jgi:spermidine synthase
MGDEQVSGTASSVTDQQPPRPPVDTGKAGPTLLLVTILFFASGLASLVYQVLWVRMLALVFGSTNLATATVLGVFMGGLALGAYLAGRLSARVKNPLIAYAALEAVIGVFALGVPFLFQAAEPIFAFAWQSLHFSGAAIALVRFLLAAAILIVPTACMGATLPLLSKFVTESIDVVGKRVGSLYAANTLGAVVGALAAGFILIPAMGSQASTFCAAATNLVLALCAFALGMQVRARQTAPPEKQGRSLFARHARAVMVCFGISGALSMVYEVTFTRALLLVIGSTTYAFTIMLSTFLTGIALGSFAGSRIADKTKSQTLTFAVCQLLVACAGWLSSFLFQYLPWLNLILCDRFPESVEAGYIVRFLLSGFVILPLTICIGATFPLAVRACVRDLAHLPRSVGTVYAANTLGAIVGSLLAGFAIVPLLGIERTLAVVALLNVGVAAALITITHRWGARPALAVGAAALAPLLCIGGGMWDKDLFIHAQSERRELMDGQRLTHKSLSQWQSYIHKESETIFWKEGASSSVAVVKYGANTKDSDDNMITIITNGHTDGSDGHDMPVQSMISAYPLLLRRDAQDVAVIGWGTGVSVGTAMCFSVRNIVAVELEPAVVEGARLFAHVNREPEKDPRLQIEYNDGRSFLQCAGRKFDVIISEPSNPWQAGVCNLFTREYFQACKRSLKPGGTVSIWLQTTEVPTENVLGVVRALNDVFKNSMAFSIGWGNIVLVASDERLRLDLGSIDNAFRQPVIQEELQDVGVPDVAAMIANMLGTPEGLRQIAAQAVPNCDDTNKLEFAVAKSYEQKTYDVANNALFLKALVAPMKYIDWDKAPPAAQKYVLKMAARDARRSGREEHAKFLEKLSASIK